MEAERNEMSRRIAGELLEIGAVSLSPRSPYTWASGLRSPVYCDNRLIMGYPVIRQFSTKGFAQIISENLLACDVVAGTATAGIPHAAWLAHYLDLPMVYVRSGSKTHGKGNQVEGPLFSGQRVVVVEDLVSTGMSSTAVISPLESSGAKVSAVLAIFTYGLKKADSAFEDAGIPLYTLTSYSELIDVASERGSIDSDDLESLRLWHQDPEAWSAQFDQ